MPDEVYKDGVVGGGLRLKGAAALPSKGGGHKKKKRKRDDAEARPSEKEKIQRAEDSHVTEDASSSAAANTGHVTPPSGPPPAEEAEDNRTDAEKAYDLAMERRAQGRAEKKNEMTHRQRVEKFNESLAKLSEHFDLPKISG